MGAHRADADTEIQVEQFTVQGRSTGEASIIVQGHDNGLGQRVLAVDFNKMQVPGLVRQLLSVMVGVDRQTTLRMLRSTLEANEN